MRGLKRLSAGGGETELAARTAAADRQRFSLVRADQPLVLEALQRGVDRADGVGAFGLRGHIAPNGQAIRVVAQSRDGDEGRKLCSLYLGIMDRMGMKVSHFGDADTRLADL